MIYLKIILEIIMVIVLITCIYQVKKIDKLIKKIDELLKK